MDHVLMNHIVRGIASDPPSLAANPITCQAATIVQLPILPLSVVLTKALGHKTGKDSRYGGKATNRIHWRTNVNQASRCQQLLWEIFLNLLKTMFFRVVRAPLRSPTLLCNSWVVLEFAYSKFVCFLKMYLPNLRIADLVNKRSPGSRQKWKQQKKI